MSMERSRSQVMFQFLPGNTFDYSDGRGIWKVNYLETSSIGGEIDRKYILNRIRYRVENWDAGYLGFNSWDPEFYSFGNPDGVRAEPYPLTFRCKRCGHAHQYYDTEDLEQGNETLVCERSGCDGNLRQYQFVSAHICGNIHGLSVPRCQNGHGRQHMKLDTQGSQKAQNFEWRCFVDGCDWHNPIAYYQKCDCDYDPGSGAGELDTQGAEPAEDTADSNGGGSIYTTVHRAGSVYYPHYLTTVNLRNARLGQLRSTRDGIYRGIAKFFELVPESTPVDDIDLDEETAPEELDEEQVAQVIVEKDDISTFDVARKHLREKGEIDSQTIRRRITELLELETDVEGSKSELTEAGDEILQYVLGNQELTTRSLEDLETAAREREFHAKADRINAYEDDLDRLGFADIQVIEDFPIQTFVYGYTRGSRQNGRINPFSPHHSDGDDRPIFVDTTDTEAVQFSLDPTDLLIWIACNFPRATDPAHVVGATTLPEVDPASTDSIARAKKEIEEFGRDVQRAFVLNHLSEVENFGRFETDTEETLAGAITEHTFQLVHSMSHILLKQISTISGFDRTNLSEFLFPRSLTFVIYANNRNEFNMGGMNTMVEQQLDTLLGQAETMGNDCVYDPVCSERGGACLSCLHVSEISCSYFNQILSRDHIYGSHRRSDRGLTGYWELSRI